MSEEKKDDKLKDPLDSAGQLLNKIGDSLYDMDLDSLTDNIRQSVDLIRNEAEKGYKDFIVQPSKEKLKFSEYYKTPYERYKDSQQRTGQKESAQTAKKKEMAPVMREIPGKIGGPVEMIFGIMGLLLFGGTSIVGAVVSAVSAEGLLSGLAASLLVIGIPCTLLSALLFGHGVFLKSRANRLDSYEKLFRGKNFIMMKHLAKRTGIEIGKIKKDIHYVMRKKLAPQLTMDKQETCLLFTDEARQQYVDAEESRIKRELEELKEKQEQEEIERKKQAGSKEEKEWIYFEEQTNLFLTDLTTQKAKITSSVMQGHMEQVETILKQILECIREHPDMISGTGHLISYYLPCMSKLLHTYEDLENQPIQGDNILKTKLEIEKSFQTIFDALTNMYDELFRNVSMDIVSDIQVMKTMMAQDGWNENMRLQK